MKERIMLIVKLFLFSLALCACFISFKDFFMNGYGRIFGGIVINLGLGSTLYALAVTNTLKRI